MASKHENKHEQDDDEVTIDFSKINIFKSKKNTDSNNNSKNSENKEEKHKEEKKKDKNDNKKQDSNKNKVENSEEEVKLSFDFSSTWSFISKYKAVFLILIPLILAIFLRMQTATMPVTDDWAKLTIENNVKSQIRAQIDTSYPNLPEQNKAAMVETEYAKFEAQNKAMIAEQVTQASAYFKSQLQDDNGLTYLITIDPYFWTRHAKNVIENGHPGDDIVDGKPYDNYMLAPIGRPTPKDMLYAYTLAYSYKAVNFFTSWSIEKVAFYLPVFLAALCVFPAYFIARKFAGDIGGFFAAMLIASHQAFLTRSMAGISDTDSFNILFPLLVVWLFIEALDSEDWKKGSLLSIAGGFIIGLYSSAWGGWWYIFDFIIAATIAYIAYYTLTKRKLLSQKKEKMQILFSKEAKAAYVFIVLFFLSSMLFTSMFSDIEQFKGFYRGPGGFTQLKTVGTYSIWPNVFTTVAEQNESSLPEIISNIGGNFLFFLSIFGILITTSSIGKGKDDEESRKKEMWFFGITFLWLLLAILAFQSNVYYFIAALILPLIVKVVISIKNHDEFDVKFAALMVLWFVSTLFASVKGVRFILLLVPAYCIGFGIFAGFVYEKMSKLLTEGLRTSEKLAKPVMIIILFLLIIAPLSTAYAIARVRTTDMNDAWYTALQKIDYEADSNAIINSWWDFGHWFKYIGNRPVTFDGTSQEYTPVHWIGRALVTDNEKEAVNILRMVDCGNYMGTTKLNEFVKDDLKTVKLMKQIIMESRDEAKESLVNNGLTSEEAESVLQYTHCVPPEDYFITSEDMIGKSRVWAHFGLWDFDKAAMYYAVTNTQGDGTKVLMEKFNLDESKANAIYYDIQTVNANDWISPWPSYLSNPSSCYTRDNKTLTCNDGLVVNLTSHNAQLSIGVGRVLKSIVYADADGVKEKIVDVSGDVTAALVPNGEGYSSVLMDPQLANSMFTRLFFFRGNGLKYFKPFEHQRNLFGNNIYVWKVDWEGKEKNVIEEFLPKENEYNITVKSIKINNETIGNESILVKNVSSEKKFVNTSNLTN